LSVEDTVSTKVNILAETGKDVDAKTVAFVKESFHETHEACDKSGASLKKATEETLAGVTAGLKSMGHETFHLVGECARAISDDTRKTIEATLAAARKAADASKAALVESSRKAAAHGKEGVDKAEKDALATMSFAYADWQKKTVWAETHLHDVQVGINAYAKSTAHDLDAASRKAMQNAAHQARTALGAMKEAAKKHSESLLHHSEAKLATWLGDLKAKLDHLRHTA